MNIPWWAWASVAALIGLAELHAPGSYLIWIAIGAGLTAAIEAGWGLSLSAQIGAFAVLSAISCASGYFIYRRFNHPKDAASLNQRNVLMIGAQGVVCLEIVNGRGKVRLGDSVWLADGPNLPGAPPSSLNQFKEHGSPWRRRKPTEARVTGAKTSKRYPNHKGNTTSAERAAPVQPAAETWSMKSRMCRSISSPGKP